MEETIFRGVSEFGVVTTMFVVLLLSFLYALFKWLPKAWLAHLEAIKELQRKFSDDLTAITTEHSLTNNRFLKQIEKLNSDHERQNKILEKLSSVQDEIKNNILTNGK